MELQKLYQLASLPEDTTGLKNFFDNLLTFQSLLDINDMTLVLESAIRIRYQGGLKRMDTISFDFPTILRKKVITVSQGDPKFEEQYDKYESLLKKIQKIYVDIKESLSKEKMDFFITHYLTDTQKETLFELGQVDMSVSTKSSNYRVNIAFRDEGNGISPFVVVRKISKKPFTLKQMGVGNDILKHFKASGGLILISGPTGSAKSSTLTSIIDYYNTHEQKNIITLEDPIEFFWPKETWKNSIILQREIGKTVRTYAEGIKSALRENPDIIIVGEIRDRESVEMMIEAANTGHLVISTGHVKSTTEIINRVLGFFDGAKSKEMALKLAGVLLFVMNQRLVVDTKGDYRVVYEWLDTQIGGIPNLIRENALNEVRQSMKELDEVGKCPHKTLSESFFELIVLGLYSSQEALEKHINESPILFQQELEMYMRRYSGERGIELSEIEKIVETQNILYRKKKEQGL